MTTILLDLGGVVFQSTGRSNATIDWAAITELNHRYGHALNIGEDQFPAFMADYNRMTQQQLTGADFLKAVFDTLEMNTELVETLRAKYEIVIVSDNYRENIAYISQRYAFHEWAAQQIYSYDYAMVKGDRAFFQRLLTEVDRATDDLLLIDDSPKKLQSALDCGIKGILFRNNELVFQELATLDGSK